MTRENGTLVKCFSISSILFGVILTLCFNGFLHLDKKIDRIYNVIIKVASKLEGGDHGKVFSFNQKHY